MKTRTYRVLAIDNDQPMTDQLREVVNRFNQDALPLPPDCNIIDSNSIVIELSICNELKDLPEYLGKGRGPWDAVVIDRALEAPEEKFSEMVILQTIVSLVGKGVWIVWTAHPEVPSRLMDYHCGDAVTPNVVQCMRLGAWDYLSKLTPRYESTQIDVVVSCLQGVAARHYEGRRCDYARLLEQHLQQQPGAYDQYTSCFVAFMPSEQNQWTVIGSHGELLALLRMPEVRSADKVKLQVVSM